MNESQDIRWIQRFFNFNRALDKLTNAVTLANERDLTELEEQGLIQAFEFTHELAWKTMKDFISFQGTEEVYGSKDASRLSFKVGLISDGQGWMNMIKSRNLSSHTYNEETADEIAFSIKNQYFNLFLDFQIKMEELKSGEQGDLFTQEEK